MKIKNFVKVIIGMSSGAIVSCVFFTHSAARLEIYLAVFVITVSFKVCVLDEN
jgi:hypothetical protein